MCENGFLAAITVGVAVVVEVIAVVSSSWVKGNYSGVKCRKAKGSGSGSIGSTTGGQWGYGQWQWKQGNKGSRSGTVQAINN